MATRVVLFDIDGTLVLTGGAGARAMFQTFEQVYGRHDPDVQTPFAGRTDTWIISEMARRHGFDHDAAVAVQFRDLYLSKLAVEVQQPGPGKSVLPGVRQLLDALAARTDIHLGLLTGNFEEGARLKLEHFDLWRYFACGAFAEDAPDRNSLFGHAMARLEAYGCSDVDPADVTIVGDTPLDVGVAKANGARSVAVATGGYDEEALRASGADEVLADLGRLSDTLRVLGVG